MRLPRSLPLLVILALLSKPALSQLPVFTTQTPILGNSGDNFFVFLPIANIGGGTATNMKLTSVALTHVGISAAEATQPASLPSLVGSGLLAPTGVIKLNLEFDNSHLSAGTTYLVTVRGTYQVGNNTYGFALNRPVPFTKGFAASHEQVLDAIAAKFDNVPGLDQSADNQTLLQFVSGLPQISNAGVGVTSSLVWAQFADTGRKLVIYNNRPTDAQLAALRTAASTLSSPPNVMESKAVNPATLKAQAATLPTELPKSKQVRVLSGLGSGLGNASSEIRRYLLNKDAGYTDAGSDATVAGFRAIKDDGVLYITSHGGADTPAFIPFHIWTSQASDPDCTPGSKKCSDPLLQADIDDGFVDEAEAKNHVDPLTDRLVTESHYHISANAFASAYWEKFGENSFVFLDICESEKSDPSVITFKATLAKLRVSVYAGWTKETSFGNSVSSALLVFDRLLGANQFCPENGLPCIPAPASPPTFAQRAFDYVQTTLDLGFHNLLVDPYKKATLVFDPLGGSFGLLVPSIGNMSVDETQGKNGQLTLNGIFGTDPRSDSDGSVEIGGSEVNIASWDPNKIVVDLNLSGGGSAGDVIVTSRGHKSNVARITDWQSNGFTFNTTEGSALKVETTFNIHFRGDIRKYRPVIHQDPIEPSGLIFAIPGSTAKFTCSGSQTIGDVTYSLSGQGTYPAFTLQKGQANNAFEFDGNFINSHQKMSFGLGVTGTTGCTCKFCAGGQCTSNPQFIFGPSNPPVAGAPFLFTFNLDEKSADIAPGKPPNRSSAALCEDESTATNSFSWNAITPTYPPDPSSPR